MKQKISLAVGLIVLAVVAFALVKSTGKTVQHPRIDGTDGVLAAAAPTVDLKKYNVDFYMENSASMDGYVNGRTEFKDVLGRMIVSAANFCSRTSFSFINDKAYKTDGKAIDFIQNLTPERMKVGNTAATDINKIFGSILKNTKPQTISVLFSDCIYSVANVTSEIDNAKNATTAAFLQTIASRPQFATVIMQFKSQFDGTYYDRNDTPMPCRSARPYYVVIMGDKAALKKLCAGMRADELPGLANSFYLSTDSWTIDAANACTITSDYTNARRIKRNRNALDIEMMQPDRDATTMRFAVGVDAAQLFTDEAYATDAANYEVEPSDYKIVQVVKASQVSLGDFAATPSCPVAIQVQAPIDRRSARLTISLRNNIPAWVGKANVNDDAGTVPPPTKSFAIGKLIEGIYNAYDIAGKRIFKLDVNIKKYKR